MGTLLSVIPVVVRRAGANFKLLVAVVIGAVLASALMSTTSIYTDTIRDLGLSFAIRERGPLRNNVIIRANSQSSLEDGYHSNRDFALDSARQAIGPLYRTPATQLGKSATFYPTAPGAAVPESESRPRSHLQFVSALQEHVNVVQGRLPADAAPYTEGAPPAIEVAVGRQTAEAANLRAGDRLDLHPFWRLEGPPVQATIAGIIEQKDPAEVFWMGQTDLFVFPSANWQTLPFFVTETTFFKTIAAYLPSMTSDYMTFLYLSTAPIDARNAETVRESLLAFERQIEGNLQRFEVQSELAEVLATFDEKLFFTRIPLLVLVLQVAGIVLYYLFMVSTMLVERQTSEIALLKSRGATTAQVMQIYTIEGLLVMVFALAAGPPLAAAVISFLGQTPPFADLSAGANLRVRLTGGAYLWAAGGALLALATLLWPALQATRRTVVQQRNASSRPPKQPVFTRYYLDLVLVGIGVILFYQLERRGTLVNEKLFGGETIDPLMLLTPAFFILTVGIVFLRLFPLVLRLLAWVVARLQGTAVLIGMWQLVRNPVHYSRLVLLLMLATAVGMFAASFGATLERSYSDRAGYESGADLRISEIRRSNASGPATFVEDLGREIGARAASPVLRLSGSQGQIIDRTSIEVLGVDPETFAAVAKFRDDFAADSLGRLLATLQNDGPGGEGLPIPAGSRWLGLWVNPVDLRGRVGLETEVRDATGRYFNFNLGPDAGLEMLPGWSFLAADLTRPAPGFGVAAVTFPQSPPQEPLTVTSISIRFITRVSANSGALLVDDLQASRDAVLPPVLATERLAFDPGRQLRPFGLSEVISGFDNAGDWQPLQNLHVVPLQDEARIVPSGAGGNAIELRWRPVQGQVSTHGLMPRGEERPLAAIASAGYLARSGLKVGDRSSVFLNGSFIEIEVADSFNLFPTLKDTRREAAVLVNGPRLAELINANPRAPAAVADEVWFDAGPDSVELARRLQQSGSLQGNLISLAELRSAQQKDPLVAAGWEGILFISFASILLLSAIGFLIYSYLTAQKRTLEFAVLRTMGFSRAQIATVVGFEQLFVIGLGMATGTLLGLRLGSLMIRYMGVTETGDDVLPPMLLHVSWLTVLSAWAILALVFMATIAVVVVLYTRLSLHRVLRIGEV
jgi:putative ABC transport system permease protein